jgi:hypothetical protein
MSATPGLTVYPKGVLLETLRRRIIALQEEGYNDDFLRAIREAHRELERKEVRLAEAERLLRALDYDRPIVECQCFHHRKPDLNHGFTDCGPFNRWTAAWERIGAFLAAQDRGSET